MRSEGAEVEERLQATLDAQLDRISRRAPEDAELSILLRVDSESTDPTSKVVEMRIELRDRALEASESAGTFEEAVRLGAASLMRQLKTVRRQGPSGAREFPARTRLDFDATVREYWLERVSRHKRDSYVGVRLAKFPEDLRVYEHLIWASKPNVVIEVGTLEGGSALWFRDRLRMLATYADIGPPRVISIDVDVVPAREALRKIDPAYEDTIVLLERDITDPGLPDEIERLLPSGSRCLVVEDSAHMFDTTMAALKGLARFVPLRGFFVVEDGSVDYEEMRLRDDWPRGVLPALRDWLKTPEGRKFAVRRDLEIYGITSHPEGFLQRTAE
jgi:cephalosporin hydroxylase/ribosome-associated translation inhibitor RaiA